MRLIVRVIMVLLLINSQLIGQTEDNNSRLVVGKLIHSDSKNDLSGVQIVLNGEKQDASKVDGTFKLEVKDGDEIKFSQVGMVSKTIIVGKGEYDFSISLLPIVKESFNPLTDKLSTAGKKGRSISDIPASIVLITSDEIKLMGYQNIEEILKSVPGLYDVEENSWTGAGPIMGVRGFLSTGHNNDMIIMVNGVNQLEDYWGYYPLSRIEVPIDAIERIEIIRGPMSVIYGSGAFFGAINIITNSGSRLKEFKSDVDTIYGSVTANMGLDNSYRVAASVKRVMKDKYYDFSAGIDSRVGVQQDFSGMINEYSGSVASSEGLLEDRRSFIGFSGRYKHFSMNVNLSNSDKQMFLDGDPEDVIGTKDGSIARKLGGNSQIGYANYYMNNILLLDAKAGLSFHRSFQDFTATGNFFGNSSYFSNAYEFEINGICDFNKIKGLEKSDLEMTLGLYLRNAYGLHTTYDFPGPSSVEAMNSAVQLKDGTVKENMGGFLQFFKTYKMFEFVGGVRAEYIPDYVIESALGNAAYDDSLNVFKDTLVTPVVDTFGIGKPVLVPRAAIICKINPKNVVKFMYGKGTKAATFGQNTDLVSEHTSLDLDPSKMTTYELNYIYTHAFNNAHNSYFTLNASLFRNNLNNLINRSSIITDAGEMKFLSSNSGQISTNGLEIGGKLNYTKGNRKWFIDLNATYQKSENHTYYYSDTSLADSALVPDVSFSPNLLAYSKLGFVYKERWSISLRSRFVDKMKSEFDASFIKDTNDIPLPEVNGYLSNELESYFVHDLSIQFLGNKRHHLDKKFWNNIDVALTIHNLFNKKYNYPVTSNNSWVTKGFLGKERWIRFQATYNF